MRAAVRLIAFFFIGVGIVGLVSPDSLMAIRQQFTAAELYAAIAVRVAMGLALILFAPASRAPKTLYALGAMSCMQGLAGLIGLDRVRTLQDWEAANPALLRAGAMLALTTGGFLAFAARKPPSPQRS